jgi:hypothetical protein
MLEPSAIQAHAESARARLAAGSGYDEVLAELRLAGLQKLDTMHVLHEALGMPLGEAKLLVHRSPVWADHRDVDEELEEALWRALFIQCVMGGGEVNAPEAWAVECRERQRRASAQMGAIAAAFPADALTRYRECLAKRWYGLAFAALVEAAERHESPAQTWHALVAVADTLLLTELLDDENAPAADAFAARYRLAERQGFTEGHPMAELDAAREARRRTTSGP